MSHVNDLKEKGYCIIKSTHDSIQKALYDELDQKIQNQELYVNSDHFCMVEAPLLECSNVLPLCIHPDILPILTEYLGTPKFDGANLRRSKITNKEDGTTTKFHRDREFLFLLKVFYYLNDVDIEGGPFTYVEGSWNKKQTKAMEGYGSKKRYGDNEIEKMHGKDNIKYLTGNCGDIIIANTTGFHKGLQCKTKERNMLTLRYAKYTRKPGPVIRRDQFDELTEKEQEIFSECRVQ